MGAPVGQAQAGGTLPQSVQNAYNSSIDAYGNMTGQGNAALGQAAGYAGQAGDVYGDMTGMAPGDVTAGRLADTNLQPYMDPYTGEVINRSMAELNRQEGIQQQGIDSSAQNQNAFGGDRMYLQKGVLGGEFGRVKGNLLADLYSKNFAQAKEGAMYDIGNKLGADTTNQNMRGNLYGMGAQGLGGLAGLFGQTGANLEATGAGGAADAAGAGFQMANTANANTVASAQAAQQYQQQAIDNANAQLARMLGIPQSYLQAMMGIGSGLGNYGTTVGSQTSQTNPGALSIAGGAAGILGSLAGMPVG